MPGRVRLKLDGTIIEPSGNGLLAGSFLFGVEICINRYCLVCGEKHCTDRWQRAVFAAAQTDIGQIGTADKCIIADGGDMAQINFCQIFTGDKCRLFYTGEIAAEFYAGQINTETKRRSAQAGHAGQICFGQTAGAERRRPDAGHIFQIDVRQRTTIEKGIFRNDSHPAQIDMGQFITRGKCPRSDAGHIAQVDAGYQVTNIKSLFFDGCKVALAQVDGGDAVLFQQSFVDLAGLCAAGDYQSLPSYLPGGGIVRVDGDRDGDGCRLRCLAFCIADGDGIVAGGCKCPVKTGREGYFAAGNLDGTLGLVVVVRGDGQRRLVKGITDLIRTVVLYRDALQYRVGVRFRIGVRLGFRAGIAAAVMAGAAGTGRTAGTGRRAGRTIAVFKPPESVAAGQHTGGQNSRQEQDKQSFCVHTLYSSFWAVRKGILIWTSLFG